MSWQVMGSHGKSWEVMGSHGKSWEARAGTEKCLFYVTVDMKHVKEVNT